MQFSEDGLIQGGIECGFQEDDGSPVVDTVFDIGKWVKGQILDLSQRAEAKAKSSKAAAERKIWIGSLEKPFARISVYGKEITVTYAHTDLIKRQGFMFWLDSFTSTRIETVVDDFLKKLAKVDPFKS